MTIYLVMLGLFIALYFINFFAKKVVLKKVGASYTKKTKISKILNFGGCLIITIIFILISVNRAISVGYDTINYKSYFDFKSINLSVQNFEFLFEGLNYIIARFGLPFQGLLLVCATITFSAILYAIVKYSAEPFLSFFLFVALGLFGNTFNAVRQYLALAVFLFSLKFIINGKFFNYMFCCVIAFLLHSSAIMLFPLYFLRYIKINYKTIIVFITLSLIGMFCLKPLTRLISTITKINYYHRYFESPEFYQPISLYYMLYAIGMIAVFVIFYMMRKNIQKNTKYRIEIYDLFLTLFYISVLIRFFGTVSGYFSLVNRFSIYFFFSIIFLIPVVIKSIKNKETGLVAAIGVFVAGICYCLYSGIIRKTNGVYPYDFIWGDNLKLDVIFYVILGILSVLLLIATIFAIKNLKIVTKKDPKKVIIARSTAIFNDSRTIKLVKELLALGYDVTVLGWDRQNKYAENEKFTFNGKTANIKFFKREAEFGSGIKNVFNMFMFQCWLKRQIKALPEKSVVHACDFDTAKPIYEVLTKQKFIYDVFDYFVESRNIPKILKPFIKIKDDYLITNADAVIICTEQRKKQIKFAWPRKVVVIHNTPDLNLTEIDNGKPVSKPSDKLKIVYVGVLAEDRLIEEVVSECGKHSDFEFHIGGVGKYSSLVKKQAELSSNVFYYGSMKYEDVLKLEKECDILFATYNPAVPNHKYSAPNKFYEAGALSKPIIVCKNTGIDQSVEKFNCGTAIAYTTDDFFDTLNKYNSNKEMLSKQGSNGNKCYNSNFSWAIMHKRIEKLYKELS